MADIFLKLLNTSITAAWVVLAVMLLRLVLKKAPKWIDCVLWGIVGLRLIMPFSIESIFSLIPSSQTVPEDIVFSPKPTIDSGINSVDDFLNPIITEALAPQGLVSINPVQILLWLGSVVWVVGMAVLVLYCIISYIRLYRRVRASVQLRDNVYICDQIETPFILGIISPRIYIPSGLPQEQAEHVVAHEKAHLKRGDHWWKPIGFTLLTVYWFNPVLWVAYRLLSRDIERACDEKVIKTMQLPEKKAYAEALAFCGNHRKMIMACPLAFGEVGVKDRIKTVLHYKKPAFWLVILSVLACTVAAVCFLTNPVPCEHVYQSEVTQVATCTQEGEETFTCEYCGDSYAESIAIVEHSYDIKRILQEPTCSHTGSGEYICTVCGKLATRNIPKADHSFGEYTVIKEPTCAQEGEKCALCKVCQEEVVFPVEKTDDHVFENTVVLAPSCSDPGEGINTCTLCGHSESCQYPLAAHAWGSPVAVTKASCSKEGQQKYTCVACGITKTEATATTAHTWNAVVCNSPVTCTVCNYTNTTGLDHQYEVVSEKAASAGFAGRREYKCTNCGAVKSVYLGEKYEYDLAAAEAEISVYAAQKGFNVIFSDKTKETDWKESRYFNLLEQFGEGQSYLTDMGKTLINRMYDYYAATGVDKYTIWVDVYYFSSGSLGVGGFGVQIFVG